MLKLIFVLCGLALAHPYGGSAAQSRPSASVEVVGASIVSKEGALAPLELTVSVPPGHTVYRSMLEVSVVEARGLSLGEPSLPPGLQGPDPAVPGQTRELYDFDVVVQIPLLKPAPPGTWAVEVDVRYQACAGSVCLMPRTERVVTVLKVEPKP